jgi:branched-chain amino acid transport system substrate-binding protein
MQLKIVFQQGAGVMKNNIFVSLLLLVSASITLVTCAQQPADTQPQAEFKCTDAIGCLDITPGDPIHIAYMLVLSGADETLGIDALNGIEIAIEDKGQILGHEILLTGEDEASKPEGGLAAATKLAADPTIVAVIGSSLSDSARDGVPILSQAGLIIVSPSNTALDLTHKGNKNNHPGYARTAHNDNVQGRAAAQFAFEVLGARKAATIHDGSLYAEQLQGVFAAAFQEMGGTITTQEQIDPDQIDMGSVLMNIAADEPELIYYPIYVKTGNLITRQAQKTPGLENTHLMGADGMFSPDVVEGAGDLVEGLYVSSPDSTAFDEAYALEFVPKYLEKYGTQPVGIYHAHAYDAFMLIVSAIEKVAVRDKDGTLHIPRQALREAVYATKDFQGLTGNLSCTTAGDCADPHIAVYQYHIGSFPPKKIWP